MESTEPQGNTNTSEGAPKRITMRKSLGQLTQHIRDLNAQNTISLTQSKKNNSTPKETVTTPATETVVKTAPYLWDLEATPEEQANKGRYIQAFVDTVGDLERAHISPRTALAAIRDLMQEPIRRIVELRVRPATTDEDTQVAWAVEARTEELSSDLSSSSKPKGRYYRVCRFAGYTHEQVKRITTYGVMSVMERLLVPASQLPNVTPWLQQAAVLLALDSDTDLKITKPAPQLLVDPSTKETRVRAHISGYDYHAKQKWSFSIDILAGSVANSAITIPFDDKIFWAAQATELSSADANAMQRSNEYSTAKLLLATYGGFLGRAVAAREAINTNLIRLNKVAERSILDKAVPWEVNVTTAGKVHIRLKKVFKSTTSNIKTIHVPEGDLYVTMQILDSMLIEFVTGGTIAMIFEKGQYTSNVFETGGANGFGLEPPCRADERDDHWHTCSGCFGGYPCFRFRERSEYFVLCEWCTAESKTPGWRILDIRQTRWKTENGFNTVFANFQYNVKPEIRSEALNMSTEQQQSEVETTWNNFCQIYQAGEAHLFHDMYIKGQVLDENVERYETWSGERRNPYSPSIEALHHVFFRNGVSRYHADGNLGSTSTSVNHILGENPKNVAKALRLLMIATSEEEVETAFVYIYYAMILRAERVLNQATYTIGTPESSYLSQLADAWKRGELPDRLYVPNQILFNTLYSASMAKFASRPEWRPHNFTYLQTQIEKIATRYHLQGAAERQHWTFNGDASGNVEVPFIFSKKSMVLEWTWHTWYNWNCERLLVMRDECNRHATKRYRDDPTSRKIINVEKFMFTNLHLFMKRFVDCRLLPPQFPGQAPRALDRGGQDPVCNLRCALSISCAHGEHGLDMSPGCPDEPEFPVEQDETAFSHDQCNWTHESWVVNAGRWNWDVFDIRSILNQFRDLRVLEHEFLLNAPRAYPAGELSTATFAGLHRRLEETKESEDSNFAFAKYFRKYAPQWFQPAKSTANNVEFAPDDTDDQDPNLLPDGDTQAVSLQVVQTATILGQSASFPSPQAANLGRGFRTCYISSVVQLLQKTFPLSRLIETVNAESSAADFEDADAIAHKEFLIKLQSLFHLLTANAMTGLRIDQRHVQAFRQTCNRLSISQPNDTGDWLDTDSDCNEFLHFVLEHLAIATNQASSPNYEAYQQSLSIIGQRQEFPLNEDISLIDNDRKTVQMIYQDAGHNNPIDGCHAIHIVTEELCNNPECSAIARTHEFSSFISLRLADDIVGLSQCASLSDMRDAYLHAHEMSPHECATCSRCSSGRFTSLRRRLVNDPNLIFVSIGRLKHINEQGRRVLNTHRVVREDVLHLSDWQHALFTEQTSLCSETKYRLIGVIMYEEGTLPHYVSFVKEFSDHSGPYVCFDDLREHPTYDDPFAAEGYRHFCESLLVYKKIAPAFSCNECTGRQILCLHAPDGQLDPARSDAWLTEMQSRDLPPASEGRSAGEIQSIEQATWRYKQGITEALSTVLDQPHLTASTVLSTEKSRAAMKNAKVDLVRREQELAKGFQDLRLKQTQFEEAQQAYRIRLERIEKREAAAQQAENSIQERLAADSSSRPSILSQLQTILESIPEGDIISAVSMMQNFQLESLSRSLLSRSDESTFRQGQAQHTSGANAQPSQIISTVASDPPINVSSPTILNVPGSTGLDHADRQTRTTSGRAYGLVDLSRNARNAEEEMSVEEANKRRISAISPTGLSPQKSKKFRPELFKTSQSGQQSSLKRMNSTVSMSSIRKPGMVSNIISKATRRVSPFLPQRTKPQSKPPVSRPASTTISQNLPYTTIRSIDNHRLGLDGEWELWVVREGLGGNWIPEVRVQREAPLVLQEYWRRVSRSQEIEPNAEQLK